MYHLKKELPKMKRKARHRIDFEADLGPESGDFCFLCLTCRNTPKAITVIYTLEYTDNQCHRTLFPYHV